MLNSRKQSGFTALELIGALAVLGFIILIGNRQLNEMNQTREYNQLADQSNNLSQLSIKYIQDNYRNLVQQVITSGEVVIPLTGISGYKPYMLSGFSKRYQTPCLYVQNNVTNKSIRAYLIFGNSSNRSKSLNQLEIDRIAKTIGNHAGTLMNSGNGYIFKGGNDMRLSSATISNIVTQCGFSQSISRSLMVDLTKNDDLFKSMKGNIDTQASRSHQDPSLKKLGNQLATMQTNLYLDNIYKESSSYTTYYCDASKLPVNDANTMCQTYASNHGITMYPGTATWTGSIMTGSNTCTATSGARFYTYSTSYTCNGVNFGDPASYCPQTLGNKLIVFGSGYWSPNPGQLRGNQCVSNAYAYYKTLGQCDGPDWWMDANNSISRGDKDSPPNWQRAATGGRMGDGAQRFIACGTKQPDDHHSMVHCPGTYNSSTGMCDIRLRCGLGLFCPVPVVDTSFAPTGGGQQDSTPTPCGQAVVWANPSQTQVDLGAQFCGTQQYRAIPATTGVPAQHIYKAVDYGTSNITGQRIQIKTAAPAGAPSESSILNVNNAGLQAGLISPTSRVITNGTRCNSTEMGKITQDMSSLVVNSQVQCTYNPTFCSTKFCYLPMKNTKFDYKFTNPKGLYMCPAGTIVDGNQPSNNILTSVNCPNIPGWTLTQNVHGEGVDCFMGITGITFCQGYQAVCSYAQGNQTVAALSSLRCTNSTTTYTVNNYTP